MNKENDFKKLVKKLEAFQESHEKTFLENRFAQIKQDYAILKSDCQEQGGHCEIECTADSINIKIFSNTLLASDENPALLRLIGAANIFHVRTISGKVCIDLWFRCWEWNKK